MPSANKSDLISEQRQCCKDYVAVLNRMAAVNRQYVAMALGHATLGLLQADFVGANEDVILQDFRNSIAACLELNTAFTAGATIAATLDKKLYLII